jgi:hypothetical protein
MQTSSPRHATPSIRALGAAVVAGVLEWVALWRSRRREHPTLPARP